MSLAILSASRIATGQPADVEPPGPGASVKTACIEAHRLSQRLRLDDQLLEAKKEAEACVVDSCPSVIRQDCSELILALEKQIPSVVVLPLGKNRKALTNARVIVDGKPIAVSSGSATQLNPGQHECRVEAPGYEPATSNFVLFEGQRYREIPVELVAVDAGEEPEEPVAPSPGPEREPRVETYRPIPPWTAVLTGVGVAGMASFSVWAALGRSKEMELRDTCSPACSKDDVAPMNTRYTIADVSLVVGGVGLAGAAITYAARPRRERRVGVQVAPNRVAATVRF